MAIRKARRNYRETKMRWVGCCDTAEFYHAASGYLGEGDDRTRAVNRILDMIEGLEIDPRQIVDAIEGRTEVMMPSSTPPPAPPMVYPTLRLGDIAAVDGSDLISRWAKETGIGLRGIYQARLDPAKFVALVGHDDATRVTPQQIVLFKEHLAERGLGAPTINR